VCDDCHRLDDWSPDQRYLLNHSGPPWRVSLLNVASGEKINLFHHPEYNLFQPHFSPDGRWITFLAQLTAERVYSSFLSGTRYRRRTVSGWL
jgi:Tol biopolymer transport system component